MHGEASRERTACPRTGHRRACLLCEFLLNTFFVMEINNFDGLQKELGWGLQLDRK